MDKTNDSLSTFGAGLIIGMVIAAIAAFIGWGGTHEPYMQGQIDCIEGKIKYELVTPEQIWKEK